MSKQLVVLAAVGAVAFIVYQKQKTAMAANGRPLAASAPVPSRNVNSDMWAAILGAGAWRNLIGGATNSGTQAFTVTDGYGRITTSDGVPVGSGDHLTDWVSANTGLPNEDYLDPYWNQNLGLSSGFDGQQTAGSVFGDYQDYSTNGGTIKYEPSWSYK